MTEAEVLLDVQGLTTSFPTPAGVVKAVNGLSFSLRRGETLAIVGESGCGKSVTSFSLMGLLSSHPSLESRIAALQAAR